MAARLKSLEMHGYKTFASRTIFAFPVDITAIVGPNGSGKSNIADAIRWVLGEQAFSLLRGRKTEDMIFAGSEQRPRSSMASATITFENENGWLPIDYTEVSITRRAYRDGQNEYLLNGQRVRLKEISELLAQSGLAERTYTIIGQGLVDVALSLKPEERRRFFEEAAGIGLYRSRRDEAINRLDNTQRNLERVQDILSELEPRLQSLERQARRVQEYERIKADLKLLLREWYGFHFHRAQAELSHTREVLRVQDERLENARTHFQGIEAQLVGQRGQLLAIRTQLNEWHAQSSGLHQTRETISRSLAVLDERQRSLIDQQQSLQSDCTRLEEEYQSGLDRLQALEDERSWLKKESDEAQKQFEEARAQLENRQQSRLQAEQAVRETRRLLVANETRLVQLKAHLVELENRQQSQRKSLQTLEQSTANEEQIIRDAREKHEMASSQKKEAEENVRAVDAQVHSVRSELTGMENARRIAQEERMRLNAEKARQVAQMEVIEQAEKSYSGLDQGTKFLMQEAQRGRLPGSVQTLNHLLEVPSEYEIAIAAALGDFWDAILLEQPDHLEKALVLLSDGQKGRAVLIPTANARAREDYHFPTGDDIVGIASNLVRYPAEITGIIDLLLGSVLVVRSRRAAMRLSTDQPLTSRVVTLQGETFWGTGMVQAGRDDRAALISRPRQKRELADSMAVTLKNLDAVQDRFVLTEKDLEIRRRQLSELENQLRKANLRLQQENQSYQSANLELEKVRQRQEWQRSQLIVMGGQLQQTADEIKNVQSEIAAVEEKVTASGEELKEQNRNLSTLSLDEFQSQVAHWNTNLAVARRALVDADRRLEEHQQTLAANRQQYQLLQTRSETTLAALEQLELDRKDQREQESQLTVALETLQVQIHPAEEQLDAIEREYSRLQENQTVAQQAVSVAERYATQAQLELSRNRDSLDSLRRRIEEDFGLVAYEYANDVAGPTPLPLEGMVEQLPSVKELSPEIEENINRQRSQLRRMGAINLEAQAEYEAVRERYQFLITQVDDLRQADIDLRQVIAELDELMRKEFRMTFDAVATEFRQLFTRLFGGGTARLVMMDADNPNESGIEIETRLPGRREQGLSLLSGGERSLTAVALVFALLKVSPTPFCVLDEVDAMLDEANVGRFRELLMELSLNTQFIVITHNRNTVQAAGVIYGITMGRDSTSQMISLKLDEINDEMVK